MPVISAEGPVEGTGKTTTVRILATLLRPDAGRAAVAGFDVVRQGEQVRSVIGLSGQYAAVDENLTGRRRDTAAREVPLPEPPGSGSRCYQLVTNRLWNGNALSTVRL
jgi:ATPase subunit of ABC transporter with duplicated ATPase domains